MCRVGFGLVACFILCFGLAGCFLNPAPPSPPEHALRLPWYGRPAHFDPGLFDPARASSSTSLLAASLVNTGLVKFSPDLHVIPELAVSIPTISADGRSYTFTIRQDARYADGSHCTAADVAYSLARALRPQEHSPLAARYLGGIQGAAEVESGQSYSLRGVHVVHRLTVRIRLRAPDATFLEKLAFPVADIMSRRGSGGLGPFVPIHEHTPSTLIFKLRHHYFGGPMHVKTVRFVTVSNASAGLDLYRRGMLDAVWIPPDKMASLSSHADYAQSSALDGYYALAPRANGAQLAAVLDRDRLLQSAGPALSALQSVVPSAVPDYVSTAQPPDAGSAASDPPLPAMRLRVAQPGNRWSQQLRRLLRQQWTTGVHASAVIWILHATFLLPDPGKWLNIVAPIAPGWYRSSLARANTLTNDPVSRMSMYGDVENWALSRGVIIPLASATLAYLRKPSVQGLEVTPTGLMPTNDNWSLVSIT